MTFLSTKSGAWFSWEIWRMKLIAFLWCYRDNQTISMAITMWATGEGKRIKKKIYIYIDVCVCLFIYIYILYIKMNVCLYLIQIHISEPIWTKLCTRLPLGLEETVGYVWARKSWPLRPFGPFFFRGTRWLLARPFSATPLYPWFQLLFAWCHRHYVVAEGRVIRGSLISVILVGVPLTSRKLHSSRRKSHPLQHLIPCSGGCLRHATDITFYRAAGPSATALYPSL
jgi:hypothetical protein